MEEDRTHPRRDSSDHTNLATQPSVLMTVLDENLNRQDVIMITSVTRALFSPQYLGCTSPGCRGCRDLCRRLGGRGSGSCRGSWGCSRCRGRAPRSWARARAGKSWPPPGRGWARSSGGTGCSDTERGTAGTVNSPEKELEGFRTFNVPVDEDDPTSYLGVVSAAGSGGGVGPATLRAVPRRARVVVGAGARLIKVVVVEVSWLGRGVGHCGVPGP